MVAFRFAIVLPLVDVRIQAFMCPAYGASDFRDPFVKAFQIRPDAAIHGTRQEKPVNDLCQFHHRLTARYIRSPMMKDMDAPDRSSKTARAAVSIWANTPAMVETRMPEIAR